MWLIIDWLFNKSILQPVEDNAYHDMFIQQRAVNHLKYTVFSFASKLYIGKT